jgi:branched-chain amino acid transport system substrate-binding protein
MQKILITIVCLILIVGSGSLASVSAQSNELKIGVIIPLSGPAAVIGHRMSCGFKLAAEQLNAKGGVLGKQIKLIEWDDMTEPERGVTGAKKLINTDKVWGLIGIFRSGVALAVAEVAAAEKTIYMDTNAASPDITALVKKDYNKYKYIFRNASMATNFQQTAVPFLTDITKAKNYFFIAENSKFSHDLFKATKETYDGLGIKCIGEAYVDQAASEFTGELSRIRYSKPDVVIASISTVAGIAFQKQYYDANMRIPHINLPSVVCAKEVLNELGNQGNYFTFVPFCWDVPITDKTVPFYEIFIKKFGYFPEGYSDVRGYDGLMILADGIKRAGTLEVEKVIKELEKTDFKGVAGRYVFDETHQSKWGEGYLRNVIVQWINGKAYVIWPKVFANATYIKDPR